jgi:hypothetical protein
VKRGLTTSPDYGIIKTKIRKGTDTMKYKALKMPADLLPMGALPKDYGSNLRVARVGRGSVILTDNNKEEVTDEEIMEALGLKDFEPKEEKEKRTKIVIKRYNEDPLLVSLTKSQIRLLNWLDSYGLLNDMEFDDVIDASFEEI